MRNLVLFLFFIVSISMYSAELCKVILYNHDMSEVEYLVKLPFDGYDNKLNVQVNGQMKKIDANDFLFMKLYIDDTTDKYDLFIRSSVMKVNNKGELESNFGKNDKVWMHVIKITPKLMNAVNFGQIDIKKSRGNKFFMFSTMQGNYTYRTIFLINSRLNVLVTEGIAGQKKVKPYNRHLVKVAPVVFKDCPELERAILADKKKKWYFDDIAAIYESCDKSE